MTARSGARELGLIVALLAVSAHFLDPRSAGLITLLAGVAVVAAITRLIGGGWRPWDEATFPYALPLLAVFGVAGVARLVAPAGWLVALLPAGWWAIATVVDLELFGFFAPAPGEAAETLAPRSVRRIRTRRRPESELPEIVVEETIAEPELPPHPRALAIRSMALALAFVGFVAAGGFIRGAFAGVGQELTFLHFIELIVLDAAVAGAVGFRLSALVAPTTGDRPVRVWAFIEYAAPAALAAWAFRALGLPRLFVPALLTLIVYIVTVVRESPEPVLLNRRLLQELGILALAGLATIAWGMLVR
jgi:hypothetical protein